MLGLSKEQSWWSKEGPLWCFKKEAYSQGQLWRYDSGIQ